MKPDSCSRAASGEMRCRSSSIPSPVSADTATNSSGGSATRGRSDLLPTKMYLALPPGALDQRVIVRLDRFGEIQHHQRQVGVRHGLVTALDAQDLDQIVVPRGCRPCPRT